MRKYFAILLCILFVSRIPITVSAHSGKTDSSGGHTDYSTGDYHYHHGYSAHDHYDMNGDGIADCPHDFVDRTGRNSGTSSSSRSYTQTGSTSAETITVYKDREVIKEVPYTPTWIKWT